MLLPLLLPLLSLLLQLLQLLLLSLLLLDTSTVVQRSIGEYTCSISNLPGVETNDLSPAITVLQLFLSRFYIQISSQHFYYYLYYYFYYEYCCYLLIIGKYRMQFPCPGSNW